MHLAYPVALSALLFSVGIYGVLARRNAVLILMSIEIMLNAVNINLIAFDTWLRDPLMGGQMFALFVITVAAAEVGVGLAIVLLIFRNKESIALDDLRELSDTRPSRTRTARDTVREEAPVR